MMSHERVALRRNGPLLLTKVVAALMNPDPANDLIVPGALFLLLACSVFDRDRFLHFPLSVLILVTTLIVMSVTLRSFTQWIQLLQRLVEQVSWEFRRALAKWGSC